MMERVARRVLALLERPLAARPLPGPEPGLAADVIVVLGAPCIGGRAGRFAVERARRAAELWARGVAPRVLVTGGPVHDEPEADCIGGLLGELGVPAEVLVLERAAMHTRENARLSAAIALPRGWRRAVLVTQRFHSRRAQREFERAGFQAEVAIAEPAAGGGEMQGRPWKGLYFAVREYLAWLRRG